MYNNCINIQYTKSKYILDTVSYGEFLKYPVQKNMHDMF